MRQFYDTGMAMSEAFPRRQRDAIRLWFSPLKGEGSWNEKGNGKNRKGDPHVSSLRIDQFLKRKIPFRKRTSPSMQRYLEEEDYEFDIRKGFEIDTFIGAPFGERQRARVVEITFNPHSHTERKTLATGGIQVTRKPTCNQCPHPHQTCNFHQYSIPKPSPPIPPRRSSSLPNNSRAIEFIANPSTPLTPFSFSPEDGNYFRFMVNGALSKLDFFAKLNLWPMVIHRFHTEPCVRHILLGTAMIHQQRVHPNPLQNGNPEQSAARHHAKAIRLLHSSLSNIPGRLHGEMREVTILTTFLLAAFELLRRNDEKASYWVENGMKLLGRPTNPPNPTAKPRTKTRKSQSDRNSNQLAQAFQILEVNLKVKRMIKDKRRRRSAGRWGAGVLSRQRLETRRSSVGAFSS